MILMVSRQLGQIVRFQQNQNKALLMMTDVTDNVRVDAESNQPGAYSDNRAAHRPWGASV